MILDYIGRVTVCGELLLGAKHVLRVSIRTRRPNQGRGSLYPRAKTVLLSMGAFLYPPASGLLPPAEHLLELSLETLG